MGYTVNAMGSHSNILVLGIRKEKRAKAIPNFYISNEGKTTKK